MSCQTPAPPARSINACRCSALSSCLLALLGWYFACSSRKCQVESGDCDRQPVYGWPGERATRCGSHKLSRTVSAFYVVGVTS